MVARHPRGFVAAMIALAVVFWSGWAPRRSWRTRCSTASPIADAGPRHQMARSSVFYDHNGRPAFTIFKEQRLEVPLDQMSPHLKKAMLAIEDQRFYDHQRRRRRPHRPARRSPTCREGNGPQGASTITQQLARLSFLTPDKTYTRKLQEAVLAALHRDGVHEGSDPRALSEQGLFRRRALRRRSRGARLLRQARVRADRGRGGDARRPGEGAVELRADRRPRARDQAPRPWCCRRCARWASSTSRRSSGATHSKVVLNDALRKEEPYGRFFKEHVRRELVARFGEERVYEGGLKVYTTIDVDMQRAADAEVQRVARGARQAPRRTKRAAPTGDAAGLARRASIRAAAKCARSSAAAISSRATTTAPR